MSYTVEKLEKSQVKFDFAVDAETFAKAIDKAYEKTKHKFSIAGFRKGHVPKKVIEGVYGKEIFFEDAMDIMIPEEYSVALDKETEIEVVAQPSLTDFKVNDDGSVNFTLVVTVKPEVKLGAYKGLEVEKKVAKVTAKEVDEKLAKEQEKQVRLVDIDSPAENGNIVAIDFS
ncbi:MAG: trigger factor, partial [Clostridia bacterium]|nr:trigger factor [Clostridia bacterium]